MRFNKMLYALSLVMLFLSFNFPILAQASKPVTNTSEDSLQSSQTQTSLTLEQRIFALQKEVSDLKFLVSQLQDKVNSLTKSSATDNSHTSVSTSTTTSTKPPTNSKPSDNEIKSALVEKFKKEVPATWAGSLMGGKNGVLTSIEILQFGNYNDQLKYWPIKIRVKGTCDADFIMTTEKRSFDKTGEFKFRQNDYGKWTADLEGF